jgi:hypothetical protein
MHNLSRYDGWKPSKLQSHRIEGLDLFDSITIKQRSSVVCSFELCWASRLSYLDSIKEMLNNCKSWSNIAYHAWKNNHRIDFKNGAVIDKALKEKGKYFGAD